MTSNSIVIKIFIQFQGSNFSVKFTSSDPMSVQNCLFAVLNVRFDLGKTTPRGEYHFVSNLTSSETFVNKCQGKNEPN